MQKSLIKALVIGVTFLFFIVTNDNTIGIKNQNDLRSKPSILAKNRFAVSDTDLGSNNTVPAGEDFPSVSNIYMINIMIL
jgi:hypothetical protein